MNSVEGLSQGTDGVVAAVIAGMRWAAAPLPPHSPLVVQLLVVLLLLGRLAALLSLAGSVQQVLDGQQLAQDLLGLRIPGAKVGAVAVVHDGNLVAARQELNLRQRRRDRQGSAVSQGPRQRRAPEHKNMQPGKSPLVSAASPDA